MAAQFIANLFAKRLGIDMHFHLCVVDQILLIFVSLSLALTLTFVFDFIVIFEIFGFCLGMYFVVLRCVCLDRAFIWIFQKNAFGLRANVCIVCEAHTSHHILYILHVFFSLLFLLLFLIQFGSIVTAFIHYVNGRQVFIICVRTHDPVTISINSNHQCESNKINNNNGNNDEIGIKMKMVCGACVSLRAFLWMKCAKQTAIYSTYRRENLCDRKR